jgi:hypothetical protein
MSTRFTSIFKDPNVANNIVRGLVGGDNNKLVMEERQVFSNIWVFKD